MSDAPNRPIRIGIVNYLNTFPLVDGLEGLADVHLVPEVPSRLIGHLIEDEVDVALCSVFDYQTSTTPLAIVPAGMLGCDGSTMTVRLFSQVPIRRITRIYCDSDSHTSINLLRVLLHDIHEIRPEFVDFDARAHCDQTSGQHVDWPESMLLIGDKVVTDSTPAIRYPYQLDLGAEWKELTGLPFVFATWLTKRPESETDERHRLARTAGAILDRQRRHNLERIDSMLHRRAEASKWPVDLARSYVTEMLRYEWTPEAQRGLEIFFRRCYDLGLIDRNRPLEFVGSF